MSNEELLKLVTELTQRVTELSTKIDTLSSEIDNLKSTIEFPIETENALKNRLFAPASTPTGYLQTISLTGGAQDIQVPATPNIWVRIKTPLGEFKILGYTT